MNMITLFCEIDDFFMLYEQYQLPEIPGTYNTRGRPRGLHPSEVMTILVHFHPKRIKILEPIIRIMFAANCVGHSKPCQL